MENSFYPYTIKVHVNFFTSWTTIELRGNQTEYITSLCLDLLEKLILLKVKTIL